MNPLYIEYTGFDMNPLYIESAKKRWKGRDNCRFFCNKVEDAATLQPRTLLT